jgi:hypothetical protein
MKDWHEVILTMTGKDHTEICYCSALEECWVLDADNVPRAVAKCPTYATPFND